MGNIKEKGRRIWTKVIKKRDNIIASNCILGRLLALKTVPGMKTTCKLLHPICTYVLPCYSMKDPKAVLVREIVRSVCSLLFLLGLLCSLDSNTFVSSVDSLLSKLLVDLETLKFLGEWLNLASSVDLWKSENTIGGVLTGSLNLICSGVINLTLLWCALMSWEEDQFLLVFVQSGDVFGNTFSRFVVSSVIDADSNSLSESWSETGFLELSKGETSTELNLVVIFSGLTENNWSQFGNWHWRQSCSLGGSFLES